MDSRMVLQDVSLELKRAATMWPPINSVHEGYAVILEEVDEFWDEVKKKQTEHSHEAMYEELVQIAAMAIRTAMDCLPTPDSTTLQLVG